MRAVTEDLDRVVIPVLSPLGVMGEFFGLNSVESARDRLWYVFKAWVNCPVEKRAQYSDEEVALFLDQLIDLVGASFQLHQANRVGGDVVVEGDGK